MFQVVSRDPKQRLIAQKPAGHDRAGDRRQHYGAENSCGPAADDFFDDEQHGGYGRIEGSRQTGGSAHRGDQPQLLARHMQLPAHGRGDTCADLQRGVIRAQRLSAPNRQTCGDELSDDGRERDVAVVDVQCSLRLVNPTATRLREKFDYQDGDNQTGKRGRQEHSGNRRAQATPQELEPDQFDADAEADDRQTGSHADHDRHHQEELLLADAEALGREHIAQGIPILAPGRSGNRGLGRGSRRRLGRVRWLRAHRCASDS